MYKQFTTDLVHLPSFELGEIYKMNGVWEIQLIPRQQSFICPLCFQKSVNHARPKERVLKHLFIPTHGLIYVRVPVYRQRCDDCGISWSVEWPGIPQRGKVTNRFKEMVIQECKGNTFQSVSKKTGISPSTITHWFYQEAERLVAKPENYSSPTKVCIDEFSLKKGHKYSLAIQDAETGHIWQVSEGRSRAQIQEALKRYPFIAPEVAVTDLAPGMAKTIQEVWPHVDIVADKFHVIQLFTAALERARKLSSKYATKHLEIRYQRRILMTDPKLLNPQEKDKLSKWLDEDTNLYQQYQALQAIRRVYQSHTYQEGEQSLQAWIDYYLWDGAPATRRIAKTLLQWKTEILNYFKYRITNAKIEGTNNLIKTIKRRSFGCPNQEKFTLRIRLECQQP